ncbi:MAG: DUF2092 domain-containing protein [Phycisphaerae bacterium]
MKRILVALMLVGAAGMAPSAKAEGPSEGMALIKKMVEAAKVVKGASYRVQVEPIDLGKKFIPHIDATCLTWGFQDNMPKKAKVEMTTKEDGASETNRLTLGAVDDEYYLIDHKTKKAYKDIDPAVLGAMSTAFQVASYVSLLQTEPYKRELESKTQEVKGTETVDGVECHVVHVVYGEGPRRSDFYIAKKDHLARKIDLIWMENEEGKGGVVITYTDLKTDPKLKDGAFAFKLPEGFEQSDDYAP